jgi:hypothetical protein
MRKFVMALLITSLSLSAFGQFFSEEEKQAIHKEKKGTLKTTLPEAEQKRVYLYLCKQQRQAKRKAQKMHPVKLHQTPEKREASKKKAENTEATLLKHYKTELTEKYQITAECLDQIEAAGLSNNWPKSKDAE